MKKILIVNGSKRRKGNSYALEARIAEQLQGKAEVTTFNIGEKDVRVCLACDGCKRQHTPNCVQKDDFTALIPEIDEVLIPGTTVVCALGQRSRCDEAAALMDSAPFVRVIGDASRVSTITNAVYWGYHAALDI